MNGDIIPYQPKTPARYHKHDLERAYPDLPDYITPNEAHAIIDAAGRNPRDGLLFATLWHTGMRISEALTLTPDHRRDNAWRVMGKRRKIRVIPVTASYMAGVLAYIVDHHIDHAAPLFASQTPPYRAITRNQAYRLLQRYAAAAGIDRPLHPHMFRHGYGVNLLRQTNNLVYVQEILGHSSIETTRIYVRAALPDVTAVIQTVEF